VGEKCGLACSWLAAGGKVHVMAFEKHLALTAEPIASSVVL